MAKQHICLLSIVARLRFRDKKRGSFECSCANFGWGNANWSSVVDEPLSGFTWDFSKSIIHIGYSRKVKLFYEYRSGNLRYIGVNVEGGGLTGYVEMKIIAPLRFSSQDVKSPWIDTRDLPFFNINISSFYQYDSTDSTFSSNQICAAHRKKISE